MAAFSLGLIVVAVLLLLPSDALPATGVWDKLEHVATFAALALLGRAAFPETRRLWLLPMALITFGAICEMLQVWVPGRTATLGDGVANALGVLMGIALAAGARRALRRLTGTR